MVGRGGELGRRSLRLAAAAAACEGGRVVTITSRGGNGKSLFLKQSRSSSKGVPQQKGEMGDGGRRRGRNGMKPKPEGKGGASMGIDARVYNFIMPSLVSG